MAILDFLKTTKKAPSAAIAEMEKSLEMLRGERAKASVLVEEYAPRRAQMLLSDSSEEEIIEHDHRAELARLRLERLEIAELALIEKIDYAHDSVSRNEKAAQLERSADAIESKIGAIDSAIGALAAAFDELVKTVPDDAGVDFDADRHKRPATPDELARAIVASGLFRAAPSIFEMVAPRHRSARPACVERILGVFFVDKHGVLTRYLPGLVGEECDIPPTADSAKEIIVTPLRLAAARLRDNADLPQAAE